VISMIIREKGVMEAMSHAQEANTQSKLTSENWNRGFLIGTSWMAGISEEANGWKAWVISLQTGSLIAETIYPTPEAALGALNLVPGQDWKFESSKSCSGEKCGSGPCKGRGCKIYDPSPSCV
jgi:hypothetical protein